MAIYQGVVHDGVVVLPEGVHLSEGVEVEVRTPTDATELMEELSPEDLQELLDERLRAAGLITGPTRRSDEAPPVGERKPIVVKGKPLSQMIIDERR